MKSNYIIENKSTRLLSLKSDYVVLLIYLLNHLYKFMKIYAQKHFVDGSMHYLACTTNGNVKAATCFEYLYS